MRIALLACALAVLAARGAHAGRQLSWDLDFIPLPNLLCTQTSSDYTCPACTAAAVNPITHKPFCVKCATGWALKKPAGVCVKCKRSRCLHCNAKTPLKCTQCQDGYKSNSSGVCKPYCVAGKDGCAKCTTQGDKKWCSRCQDPGYVGGKWTIWTATPAGTCKPCDIHDPTCHMCDASGTQCVLCDDPAYNPLCSGR